MEPPHPILTNDERKIIQFLSQKGTPQPLEAIAGEMECTLDVAMHLVDGLAKFGWVQRNSQLSGPGKGLFVSLSNKALIEIQAAKQKPKGQ